MSVLGLSDSRRLPRLGKIRLGIKVKGTKNGREIEYPQAVDYMVCPPEVQEVYGERPTSLPVVLPANEIEDNLPLYLKRYGKTRGLICKGNGETASQVDTETGEIVEIPCPYKQCPFYQKNECKEIATLSFLLPEVEGIGVWQIDTSSINSILNLQSEMALTKRICGGKLAGLPFDLTLESQDAQVEGRKKTIHVLHLRSRIKLAELRALPPFAAVGPAALPSSDEFPEELYPELAEQAALPASTEAEVEVVTTSSPPLNANGDSELPDQQNVYVAATKAGLTTAGAKTFLISTFGTDTTTELSREDCAAAIGAIKWLPAKQIEKLNAGEPFVPEEPETGGNDQKAAIEQSFERLGWSKARQVHFIHGNTGCSGLDKCTASQLQQVRLALDGELEAQAAQGGQ